MPRKYSAKIGAMKRVPPDAEKIKGAVNAVKNGGSYKATARQFGINVMTLKRLCRKNMTSLPGYKVRQVFSIDQEKELGKFVEDMSKMYYGLTVVQLRKLAYSYAATNNIPYPPAWDKTKQAGRDWYRGFLDRNPTLALRTPEATSLARSIAFNRHTVGEFFNKLTNVYTRYEFPPERIWNIDETGVTTVHKPAKIIAVKGSKQVGKITSAERGELVTVCASINSAGGHVPPFMIFPRKNWQDRFLSHGPPGSNATTYPSGWMTCPSFINFLEHFVRFAQPSLDRKHLIIMDNHESHCSVEAVNYARDNGIVFLTIPPHTSHKLQPLDRTVFGPLKTYYSQAASNFMLKFPGRTITIYDIAELLGDAFPRAMAPTNILNGFKVSGIWPINPSIFTDDEFMTSAVTDRPDPTLIQESVPDPIQPTPGTSTSVSVEPTSSGALKPFTPLDIMSVKHFSPQDIMPYPKAAPRVQSSRGRKRGRSRILTDTPEKAEIEELAFKKIAKEAAINKKREEKLRKLRNTELFNSTDDEEDDIPSLPDSSGGSDFLSQDDLIDDKDPEPDDFVLVKFPTKKTVKFYVGKVLSLKGNTLEVNFLRRKGLVGSCFTFPIVEDISEVDRTDVQKLPQPSVSGTARTADIIKFNHRFDANVF